MNSRPWQQRQREHRKRAQQTPRLPEWFFPLLLLAFPLISLLFSSGCLDRSGLDLPPVRTAPAPPSLLLSLDWPLGRISPQYAAMVRLTRETNTGPDYDHQYRLDTAGVHLIRDLAPGTYRISAYIDLNNTQELESGGDAIAGEIAAWYDPLQTRTVTVPEHGEARFALRFLQPLGTRSPEAGATGTGNYPSFRWQTHPLVPLYDLRVWRRSDDIAYRLRTRSGEARYGTPPPANSGQFASWPQPLNAGQWYFWDVTGLDGGGYAVAYAPSLRFVP